MEYHFWRADIRCSDEYQTRIQLVHFGLSDTDGTLIDLQAHKMLVQPRPTHVFQIHQRPIRSGIEKMLFDKMLFIV